MTAPPTTDARAYLASVINAADAARPIVVEGDCLELLARLPDGSIDLIATSPPYPRGQRKPEDLGRYRRFLGDDGSVIAEASNIPFVRQAAKKLAGKGRYRSDEFQDQNCEIKREQYAGDQIGAGRSPKASARRAALKATIGAPHARKKLAREGLSEPDLVQHEDGCWWPEDATPEEIEEWRAMGVDFDPINGPREYPENLRKAADHPNGPLGQRDRAVLGFTHGRPNLRGETGLQVQIHPDNWWTWFRPIAEQLHRVLKRQRPLLLNLGGVVCPTWHHHTYDWDIPSQMRSIGFAFVRPIYWVKPNGAPTTADGTMTNCVEHIYWFSKDLDDDHAPIWNPWELHRTKDGHRTKRPMVRNVWEVPVGTTRWPEGQAHFACYPLELAENMVRGFSFPARAGHGMFDESEFSTDPDLVLDPFAGSGTTLIAARLHGRRSLGIKLNPEGEISCAHARWEMEFGAHE